MDWIVVKMFAAIYAIVIPLSAIGLPWGVWTPFAGCCIAGVLTLIVTTVITVLEEL